MEFRPRELYPDEVRALKTLRTQAEKASRSGIKWYHYALAAVLGAGCAYFAMWLKEGFWMFLSGTLAVFAVAFIVFTPWEACKNRKAQRDILQRLCALIDRGGVGVCPVEATRIARAGEYEDESDLYIIETGKNRVLYLYDLDYNFNRKKFPCLRFEVYDDEFRRLTGRQIYPLSDKMIPIEIDEKKKWEYMQEMGAPGNLSIENIGFDELIKKWGGPIPSNHTANQGIRTGENE